MIRRSLWLALVASLASCPKPTPASPKVNRCEVDLAATGLFSQGGQGASAALVTSADQLIGGSGATGRTGDVLLQNDKLRVVIEQPGRTVGPFLSGGGIVDADVTRAGPGADEFGRMALFYSFGRLPNVTDVEVLMSGEAGGPAVVAATGVDAQHDLINLQGLLTLSTGVPVNFVVDPNRDVPLRITTYYVLSPGESRVRMLTSFCNDGDDFVQAPLVELLDVGTQEIFNPGGCFNGIGGANDSVSSDCLLDKSKWVGAQGHGVAYGLRSYALNDLTKTTDKNALVAASGIFGSFVEGESLSGLLSWTDANARNRPGTFGIKGHSHREYLRDFVVAQDIAAISSAWLEYDHAEVGTLAVTTSLPGARVSVEDAAGVVTTILNTDAQGQGHASLPAGNYTVSAALEGHLVGPTAQVTIQANQRTSQSLQVLDARTLTVRITEAGGGKSPGKITVLCTTKPCPFSSDTYKKHLLVDAPPGGAARMAYVAPSGEATVTLPPGEYDVVVSRGPEYSTWPDTWPTAGHHVDLRTADATVDAVVGRVVDSTGWQSADLHVHAANSSDSDVANELRVANFLAEGIDVMVSTDHEVLTDFAPVIRALGGEHLMASAIGEEITSFTHGHFNAYPLTRAELPNGGAFDHAGGFAGPEYRLADLWPAVRAAQPGSMIQINHPRGSSGALTQLRVDTATLATHGDPADYHMQPAPDATADDTKLLGDGFDGIETANGTHPSFAVLNDWMTFLSRGTVRTATGVSDTHKPYSDIGGYSRTYVNTGVDLPEQFSASAFADTLRSRRAFVTNGPFLRVTATKLDGAGQPSGSAVGMGDTLSIASGGAVAIDVDVQGPEWLQINRVELYSHAAGREAVNGVENKTWPDGRILEVKTVDAANLPIEAVPGSSSLRRAHVTERFVVHPDKDTWFVVMVRGLGTRSMYPLHDSEAVAYSNAILIDADGSGKYDDFPLKLGQPLRVAPKPKQAARALTVDEAKKVLRSFVVHEH